MHLLRTHFLFTPQSAVTPHSLQVPLVSVLGITQIGVAVGHVALVVQTLPEGVGLGAGLGLGAGFGDGLGVLFCCDCIYNTTPTAIKASTSKDTDDIKTTFDIS
jgi:hypothetical protein